MENHRYLILAFATTFLFFALEIVGFAGFYFTTTYFFAQLILAVGLLAMVIGGTLAACVHDTSIDWWLRRALYSYALLPLLVLGAVLVTLVYTVVGILILIAAFIPIGFVLTMLYRKANAWSLYAAELFGAVAGLLFALTMLPLVREENSLLILAALAAAFAALWLFKTGRTPRYVVFAALSVLLFATVSYNVRTDEINLAVDALCTPERQEALGVRKIPCIDETGVSYRVIRSLGSTVDRIDIISTAGGDESLGVAFSGTQNDIIRPYPQEAYRYDARIPGGIIEAPDTLIIGASIEGVIKPAYAIGSRRVTALEFNQAIVDVWEHDTELLTFAQLPVDELRLLKTDGRSFLADTNETYDVITLMNTRRTRDPAQFGQPDFLHTTEAFHAMFDHLSDRGFISVEEPNFLNASDEATSRIVHTIKTALRKRGIENPADHIIAYEWTSIERGQILTARPPLVYTQLLVKKTPWTSGEIAAFEQWKAASLNPSNHTMSAAYIVFYRLLWSPDNGIPAMAADSTIAHAIVDSSDIRAITDIFPHVSKMSPYQKRLVGYIIVLFLLILSASLLYLHRGSRRRDIRFDTIIYFVLIGLGYIFVEVFLLNWLLLYLGSVSLAFAATLGGLFVSGGCASLLLRHHHTRIQPYLPVALVVASGVFAVLLSKPLLEAGFPVRVFVSVISTIIIGAALAPFFPVGIINADAKHTTPLFVGVNGAALAVGVVLALCLSAYFGYGILLALVVLMYAIAIVMLRVPCYSR